jgi:hypothetical protein
MPVEIIEALRAGTMEWPEARDALIAHPWKQEPETPGYAGIIERWHDVPDAGEFEVVFQALDVIGYERRRELYAGFSLKAEAREGA